jgi:hypothetical protein
VDMCVKLAWDRVQEQSLAIAVSNFMALVTLCWFKRSFAKNAASRLQNQISAGLTFFFFLLFERVREENIS